MDKDLRLAALEARNNVLEARIADLESALIGSFVAPFEWKLTAMEERMFSALTTRDFLTKEALMVILYDDALLDRPEIKIVDVFICKLRKKLLRFDIEIVTLWGRGYGLKDRALFKQAA